MAEHHVARCEHETRLLKKDLQRWSRTMLTFLGLEKVAESLLGTDRWICLNSTYAQYSSDLPSCDWNPEESFQTCAEGTRHASIVSDDVEYLQQQRQRTTQREAECEAAGERQIGMEQNSACATKLKAIRDAESSSPERLWKNTNSSNNNNHVIVADDNKDDDDDADGGGCGGAVQEDELLRNGEVGGPPPLLRLDTLAATAAAATAAAAAAVAAAAANAAVSALVGEDEQPLDLSVKSASPVSSNSSFDAEFARAEKPCVVRALLVPPMNGSRQALTTPSKKVGKVENSGTTTPHRRNYSDADLQAALREIRSGQLGTRKASIIYGVPRSTLRNKVYKLQANDRRVSALAVSRAAVEDQRKERVLDADCEIDVEAVDGDGGSPPSGGDWIGSSRVVMSSELATNSGAASPVQLRRRQFSGASEGCRSPNSANPGLELSLKDVIARTVTNRLSKVGSGVEEKIDPSDPKSAARTTRPKRGKYRNYDQENLLEAVKAVQRGEMSVHRAGTFYGVPHSTLEYKVKERHLMRPRKRPRKDELMSSTLHPRGDVESSASSENNAPRRRESGSSSESDSCVEVPLSLSAPPAPAKSGNGNGIAPAYFPPNYTPLGIPPSYMFWGSRPAFHPHATPLAPLPTLEANNPFSRWLACKPWSMDNASPRSESGLTFEEARRQWLKSSPPGIVEQNLTSSTLSAAAVKIEDRNGPSYKDDLRAAIVAMEKAVEDEAS